MPTKPGIPLTAERHVEFIPPALLEREPPWTLRLKIRVPTMYERDSFAATMIRHGVVHYSKKQIRDLLLAGVSAKFPPEEFDKVRGQLAELWAVTDSEMERDYERSKRLVEIMDIPDTDPTPTPEFVQEELEKIKADVAMDQQQRARIVAIQQDITSTYEPLQKVFADLAEQDIKRSWIQAETYICGWNEPPEGQPADGPIDGLELQPALNGRGALQRHEAEYLRGKIGSDAWLEISDFITALHQIDEDEEKNLASLLASKSGQTGSIPTEDSKASSGDGTSTAGSTTATQGDELPKTTGSSSNSSTPSKTRTGASRRGRTGAGSSTSR